MKRLMLPLSLMLLSLPAAAQVSVQVNIPLPTITFTAPPPLVVVQPGVQMVQSADEEVYVVNNVYWVRRQNVWYRSPDHRGHWQAVPVRAVPVSVVRIPEGHYRHMHGHAYGHERREHEEHEGRGEGWIPPGHRGDHGHGHGHGHGHDD